MVYLLLKMGMLPKYGAWCSALSNLYGYAYPLRVPLSYKAGGPHLLHQPIWFIFPNPENIPGFAGPAEGVGQLMAAVRAAASGRVPWVEEPSGNGL